MTVTMLWRYENENGTIRFDDVPNTREVRIHLSGKDGGTISSELYRRIMMVAVEQRAKHRIFHVSTTTGGVQVLAHLNIPPGRMEQGSDRLRRALAEFAELVEGFSIDPLPVAPALAA